MLAAKNFSKVLFQGKQEVMCNHRVRTFGFLLAAIAATGYALTASAQEGQVSTRAIAFYCGWYGNPQTDGAYHNWNHRVADKSGRRFPGGEDIGANFYPQAGCKGTGW